MSKSKQQAKKAQVPTDPVLDILTWLTRYKSSFDKAMVQDAIGHYNKLIDTNIALQKQAMEAEKQQKSSEDQLPDQTSSQQASKATEKYKERYEAECKRSQQLEEQINELRNRLSKFTGDKMKEGNSNITDLSDPYRPTKLAETFRELYDNEWTNAYDALLSESGIKDDNKIIEILSATTKEVDQFCKAVSSQQLDRMHKASDKLTEEVLCPNYTDSQHRTMFSTHKSELSDDDSTCVQRHVRDIRKELAYLSVRGVVQLFEQLRMTKIRESFKLSKSPQALNSFVERTTSCVWMTKLQDKPIEMMWLDKGEAVDKKRFTFYTNRGDTVAMTIWPALLLHSEGPLLCKGVLQGK